MKSTLLNAGIIIGASVVIALVYNAIVPNPLALVRKPIVLPPAADSSLFADEPQSAGTADTGATASVEEKTGKEAPPDKKDTAALAATTKPKAVQDTVAAEKPAEKPKAQNVTYDQVVKLVKDANVLFIDARNADDYGHGHIGNAKNYFTHDFEKHIPEIVQIDRNKRIVVYCGGGACELSHELAANLVESFGFKRVFVYTGGWDEWSKKQGSN